MLLGNERGNKAQLLGGIKQYNDNSLFFPSSRRTSENPPANQDLDNFKQFSLDAFKPNLGSSFNKPNFVIQSLQAHESESIPFSLPPCVQLLSTQTDLQGSVPQSQHFYCKLIPFQLPDPVSDEAITSLLQGAFLEMASDLIAKKMVPCVVCNLNLQVRVRDNLIVVIQANVYR